jgi:hypothetical protein
MNPLLYSAIALVKGWTRIYTSGMEPVSRDRRRAEVESDLWEFHEDARRHRASPPGIAIHMFIRLVAGIPYDMLWRFEDERDRAMTSRRSSWMTAGAIGAACGVAALWALFAFSSLASLPPLPDSIHVERIYLRPMPPPPPPPPPPGVRVARLRMPPPPPPPPPK